MMAPAPNNSAVAHEAAVGGRRRERRSTLTSVSSLSTELSTEGVDNTIATTTGDGGGVSSSPPSSHDDNDRVDNKGGEEEKEEEEDDDDDTNQVRRRMELQQSRMEQLQSRMEKLQGKTKQGQEDAKKLLMKRSLSGCVYEGTGGGSCGRGSSGRDSSGSSYYSDVDGETAQEEDDDEYEEMNQRVLRLSLQMEQHQQLIQSQKNAKHQLSLGEDITRGVDNDNQELGSKEAQDPTSLHEDLTRGSDVSHPSQEIPQDQGSQLNRSLAIHSVPLSFDNKSQRRKSSTLSVDHSNRSDDAVGDEATLGSMEVMDLRPGGGRSRGLLDLDSSMVSFGSRLSRDTMLLMGGMFQSTNTIADGSRRDIFAASDSMEYPSGEQERARRTLVQMMRGNSSDIDDHRDNHHHHQEDDRTVGTIGGRSGFWSAIGKLPRRGNGSSIHSGSSGSGSRAASSKSGRSSYGGGSSTSTAESSVLAEKRRLRRQLYVRRCARAMMVFAALAMLSGAFVYLEAGDDLGVGSSFEALWDNVVGGGLFRRDSVLHEREDRDEDAMQRKLPRDENDIDGSSSNNAKPLFEEGTGINHYNLPRREKQRRARESRQLARFMRLERREMRKEYNSMRSADERRRVMVEDGGDGDGDDDGGYHQVQEEDYFNEGEWVNQEYTQEYNEDYPIYIEDGGRAVPPAEYHHEDGAFLEMVAPTQEV